MHLLPKVIAAALVLAAAPAIAQDHSMHGGAAAPESKLPAICLENAKGHDMSAMAAAPAKGDEAHKALAATMDAMHGDMAAGMTATDIDVAFVCGMIPHHQGAIDMAKVELQYGKDEWARGMAQKVIDAQEQEIADMLKWLEDKSK